MKTISFKSLLFAAALLLSSAFASAAPHNTVILKNGSSFSGDIIVQRPGKDITIETESATIVIPPRDIISDSESKVKYEDLSREWKRKVLEKQSLQGDAYGRYAVMHNIKTRDYTYSNIMKEHPDKPSSNSYIQVSPSSYKINWKDVAEIKTTDVKSDNLIDEVVTKKGKVYTGKIISQVPGGNISIDQGNTIARVSASELKEIRKKTKYSDSDIFREADYVNVVTLKTGKEIEGIIVVNHPLQDKSFGKYIILQDRSGEKENIRLASINEYKTKYTKHEEDPYLSGQVYVNEFKTQKANCQNGNGKMLYFDKKVFPFPEGIDITFKSKSTKFPGNWVIVALKEFDLGNGKTTYGYDPAELKNISVKPKSTDRQSALGSITFGYLSPGYYALVNNNSSESYIIKIVK